MAVQSPPAATRNPGCYSITAKAEGIASDVMMLKALLEDRFKLKTHRETKEVPIYELTVAKDGLKAPRFAAGSTRPSIGIRLYAISCRTRRRCTVLLGKRGE